VKNVPSLSASAPGRISLAGAGTDIPPWYERRGGAVVTLALSPGVSASASVRPGSLELVGHDGAREVIDAEPARAALGYPFLAVESLRLPKAVAWHFGLEHGSLAVESDLAPGNGLGSTPAACVALVTAVAAFTGVPLDRPAIGETAARVMITVLRRSRGKHDAYACALGGANLIRFLRDGSVVATPIEPDAEAMARIESHLGLFSNGVRRDPEPFLAGLARRCNDDAATLCALAELQETTLEVRTALERGDPALLGRLLDGCWSATRRLHRRPVPPDVDRALMLARGAGAYGGTSTGPGAPGTIIAVIPPSRRADVRSVLASQGWRETPFAIDREGAVVRGSDPLEATL
jgi:D-glycero-alpha-D-manno-heptose-7-phosphate kinase